MKEKIKKQKGFIQNPLLVIIIFLILAVGGTMLFLYKQSRVVNISKLTEQEQQIKEAKEQSEKLRIENERLKKELEAEQKEGVREGEKQEQESIKQYQPESTESYESRLFSALSLCTEMYQLMESYAEDFGKTVEERINALNYLVETNKQMGLQDSYLNELTLADLNYTEAIRDVFKSYEAIAQYRISKQKELLSGLKALDELINGEGFKLLMYGIETDGKWALDWIDEMGKYVEKYLDYVDFANKNYERFFSGTKPTYSTYPSPDYFASPTQPGHPSNFERLRQTQVLENIAEQLQNIFFEISR